MSLFEFLRGRVPYLILLRRSSVFIEEWPSRLYSRTTFLVILALSTLQCWVEYLGKNIMCLPVKNDMTAEEAINSKFMETYCYIQTTFTVPYNAEGKHQSENDHLGGEMPGGWPYVQGRTVQVHHAYYQWVPFFLYFLALLFYIPHAIWKEFENNTIQSLIQDLNARDLVIISQKHSSQTKLLAAYLWKSKGSHKSWSTVYILCEVLNLVIVCFTMFITDVFLNGEFAQYGLKAIKFLEEDPETRVDPMSFVFPRLTKCQFRRFGSSGTIENFDTLCILSSNILNEKIFIFLWVWFILLAVLTIVMLLYRFGTIVSFRVRLSGLGVPIFSRNSQIITILERLSVCDWMLLRLLRINLDEHTFMRLMTGLYDEVLNSRLMTNS